MNQLNIHQAKTQLSRLLVRVQAGEEFIIAKAGKPVAKLVPITQEKKDRVPDLDKGLIKIKDDFDELPPEILADFEA